MCVYFVLSQACSPAEVSGQKIRSSVLKFRYWRRQLRKFLYTTHLDTTTNVFKGRASVGSTAQLDLNCLFFLFPSTPPLYSEELSHKSREIKKIKFVSCFIPDYQERARRFSAVSTDFENMFCHHLKGPWNLGSFSLQVGQGDLFNKGREGPAHSLSSTIQVQVYGRLQVWNQQKESPSEKAPVGP